MFSISSNLALFLAALTIIFRFLIWTKSSFWWKTIPGEKASISNKYQSIIDDLKKLWLSLELEETNTSKNNLENDFNKEKIKFYNKVW